MDRLIAPNTVVAAQADAAPATGTPAYATDGNPASNIPATQWPAYQYNAIQEELMAVIIGAGITADRTNNAQLLAAIKSLRKSSTILADTGVANAYTAVNPTPLVIGTWVDGVIQQVKIAHANTGASTYAPDGLAAIPIYGLGLQPLQGGELALNGTAVLMHATIAGVNSGNPVAVLMECFGGAQQVAPATQSQHAAQLGQLGNAGVVPGRLLRTTVYRNNGGTLQSSINGGVFANASSTFTSQAATSFVDVEVLGGGGAGGGTPATGASQISQGAGGGGGGYSRGIFTSGFSGVTVAAGAAGVGAAGVVGGNGGSSSFGALISATGGGGGTLGVILASGASSFNGNGSGGQGSGGQINAGGGFGYYSAAYGGSGVSGKGGGSVFGDGGAPVGPGLGAGIGAPSNGGGGSGGVGVPSGPATQGGNGASGLVIVREYA